ncbi:MAG TPA: ArsA family ATPase, partial [Microthrixaceae bacterium]|nr:ArsA family ATPase [Microthrixaceae bacterium]
MEPRPHLLDRRLLFVTGKGGVGKSTIASSLALLAANEGKRTLVCEVDAKGNLADFYGTKPLRFEPTEVQAGLFAMSMDTEESLREYLRLQLHVPLIARLGPLARTFDFVATAAPGVKEILTVGKLAYEVRERNYDLVVVDASATGHVVGQLASPVAMKELVSVGIVRQQTEWMLNILTDPDQTGVVVVATPEEMPVNETIELIGRLDSETDIDVAAVIANRVLPELFNRDEEAAFDLLDADTGRSALADLVGAESGTASGIVLDAARLAVELRRSRAVHLHNLADRLPESVPLINVPYL